MEFKCPLTEEKRQLVDEMLAKRPTYSIGQINGQRIYRSESDDNLRDPKKGSEVFVGALPRDCYEDELVPVFETIGTIRRLRLMMDFSGTNRGYAYVLYSDPSTAKEAAERLDGHELRPNRPIGVTVSYDKRRLFIGGIPKNKKKKDVLKEMKKVTDGVKDVILYMSVYNYKNRGFCFVDYESHHNAAMARRRMGDGFVLWGKYEVRVDWADPEPEIDDEIMSKVKIIHIRNLPLSVTEEDLRDIFGFNDLRIERVRKIRDFAFIHYESREETETALSCVNDSEFPKKNPDLNRIQVSLARPPKNKPLRKRTVSAESSSPPPTNVSANCDSTQANSSQSFYPLNVYSSPQTQVGHQLRYYQNLYQQQTQQLMLSQQMPPLKYDRPIIEDKNSFNLFVVWVPIVWVPQNQNKGQNLSIENNYYNKIFRD